jgi:hypothetical protein
MSVGYGWGFISQYPQVTPFGTGSQTVQWREGLAMRGPFSRSAQSYIGTLAAVTASEIGLVLAYGMVVDMATTRFGAAWCISKWIEHIRVFKP